MELFYFETIETSYSYQGGLWGLETPVQIRSYSKISASNNYQCRCLNDYLMFVILSAFKHYEHYTVPYKQVKC